MPSRGLLVDALEELREMHVETREALERIEAASPADRLSLWARLRPELELHEQIEDRFVYEPVARDAAGLDATLVSWDQEHEAQVGKANALIFTLDTIDPFEDGWLTQLVKLHEMLAAHIANEEQNIWPRIRRVWGDDELDRAARPIAAAKAAAKNGAPIAAAIATAGDHARPAL